MFKNWCSSRMVLIWCLVSGLLFGGSLLLAFWGMPKIIESQIHAQTMLKNGTDQWDRFVEIPFPLDYKVRFFQVNNTDQVKDNNTAPDLKESESYNYKITINRQNVRIDDFEEDTVTFENQFTFQFDNSGSVRETDEVTILNPLLLSSMQLTSGIQRLALAGCIDVVLGPNGLDKLFITKPVKEILFDGITFGFLNATGLGPACTIVRNRMADIVANIRVIEPIKDAAGVVEYYKFSIFNFKTKNYVKDSVDGIFTINRGIKNMTALGNTQRWNGKTSISTYGNRLSINNNTCQKIRGTDTTIFHPLIQKDEVLTIYNTDLCRFVDLYHTGEITYKGVKGLKFSPGKSLFRHSTLFPENDCYCSKATSDLKSQPNCYLDGVFDFKPCLGAPVLISQPHFLHADEHYQTGVVGLSPDESAHDIYLVVEPNTGTPLQGFKRVQMNSVLRRESLVSAVLPPKMYQGIIPILWLEEGVSLPDKYVDIVKNQYFAKVRLATGLKYGLIATSASIFAASLYVVWRKDFFRNSK